MKKKLIIIISILVIVIGGYLIFKGIFGQEDSAYTKIPVARGEVAEIVSVTGTVIPAKEIDLQFESAGKISRIEAKVSDRVLAGQVLVRLEAGELSAQLQSYQAVLDRAEAKLAQTLAGTRSEDIQVYQSAVDSARVTMTSKEQALTDAQENADNDLKTAYESALDTLKTSYTKADQALLIVFKGVREDYFYDSSQLTFSVKEKENIAKDDLTLAKQYLDIAEDNPAYNNIDLALSEMKSALRSIRDALSYLRAALDDSSVSDEVSSIDKTNVDTERTTIDTQLTSVTTAEQTISSTKVTNQTNLNTAQANLDSAQAALTKAENELILKKAGPRQADIDLARAEINQAKADIRQIQEKINKTILKAPINGIITAIEKEVGETAQINSIIVSMIGAGNFQIEANISETEIAKVNLGDKIEMTLDALGPDEVFVGQVIKIDPAETVVSGVIYYRVTSVFETEDQRIKSGMTVNLDIQTDKRENVLYLPYYAIKQADGRKYVQILENSQLKEKDIKIGLEGENDVEIIEGLTEGEEVIVEK